MNHVIPSASTAPASFDVLIIGTGPVGATYARTIHALRPAARILMIDAGPQLTSAPGTNVRNITDPTAREHAQIRSQGPTQFPYSLPDVAERARASDPCASVSSLARPGTHLFAAGHDEGMPAAAASTNVGGMGAHWTCACPRPGDGETMSLLDTAEWQRLFAIAEPLLSVTAHAFANTDASSSIALKLANIFDGKLGERKVQRMPLACSAGESGRLIWTGADTILGPLADPENHEIELWANTLCRRLLVEGNRVVGVLAEQLQTHEVVEVRAHAVVVAADALRTPQLLWASGIRPRALGHYLNDQPQIVSVLQMPAADDATSDFTAPLGVFWVPYSDPHHPFHGQVMHMGTSPIPLAETEQGSAPSSFLTLGWFCAKDVRFEDCITFSDDEQDYLGMPAPTIHYALSAADAHHVNEAIAFVTQAAQSLGDYVAGYEPSMIPAGSSLHYQGSTRMGDDRGDSVCDTYSRVWDFENLFVGGNGVISTSTACNPTLTSCALAMRSSEELVRQLTSARE